MQQPRAETLADRSPVTKTSIRTWSPVWWGRTLISALSSEVAAIYSHARLNVRSQQPMVGCLRAPPGDSWCSPGQAGGGGWGQGGLGDPAPDKWGWTLTGCVFRRVASLVTETCGSVSLLRTPFHHYRGALTLTHLLSQQQQQHSTLQYFTAGVCAVNCAPDALITRGNLLLLKVTLSQTDSEPLL